MFLRPENLKRKLTVCSGQCKLQKFCYFFIKAISVPTVLLLRCHSGFFSKFRRGSFNIWGTNYETNLKRHLLFLTTNCFPCIPYFTLCIKLIFEKKLVTVWMSRASWWEMHLYSIFNRVGATIKLSQFNAFGILL